jgi:hypothetical protein
MNTSNSLLLEIGGISVLIISESAELIAQSRERYTNFIAENLNPRIAIEVEVVSDKDMTIRADTGIVAPDGTFDRSTGIATISWHGFTGVFDVNKGTGKMRYTIHPMGLNSFLRFIYSLILLDEPGFLVHASSLIKNSRAYIFPGKSGAGKTTISQITPDRRILSDDLTLIKIIDNDCIVFGTPFWGSLAVGGENISTSVTGIYFLIKDRQNYTKKITVKQALERLLPNIVFFVKENASARQLFELCYTFVNRVPAYELHFLPEPSLWGCIDAE